MEVPRAKERDGRVEMVGGPEDAIEPAFEAIEAILYIQRAVLDVSIELWASERWSKLTTKC